MTITGTRSASSASIAPSCDAAGNITRSLLGYLALAGPFYVAVSLAEALTRTGFRLSQDEWSLLAVGHLGWIQQANLILAGAMTITGAIGVRRALGRRAVAGTWAPRLLAGYGSALIAAGVFTADAADGFPAGTPLGRPVHPSWHGTAHMVSGSIGFACLIAACFVLARGYARRGAPRIAIISRAVGVLFAVSFLGIASGASNPAINLAFTAAIITSYAWLTAVAVGLYQRTRAQDGIR
jgi:hypothetical protein